MKLVIFGAGASYDSIYKFTDDKPEFKWRPPLGNDIFGLRKNFKEILKNYPGAESLVSETHIYNDIEKYFQEKWDHIIQYKNVALLSKLINVQYYLQHLFNDISNNYNVEIGLSNYEVIVRKAFEYSNKTNEEICFISFNYDTLLERAIQKESGNEFYNIETYLDPQNKIKLIKPHGSCNWYSKFNLLLNSEANLKYVSNILYKEQYDMNFINQNVSNEYLIWSNNDRLQFNGFDNLGQGPMYGGFPRILIPLKSKDEFVLPKAHEKYLNNYLTNVDDVLIIGWKGAEESFLKLLNVKMANKNVNVTVVNCYDTTIEDGFKFFPNLNNLVFNYYDGSFDSDDLMTGDIHKMSSFSSYIINNEVVNFFK